MKTKSISQSTIKALIFTALIFLGQFLTGIPTAQTQKAPIKNIVLVHGAFADGSGWKGVYDIQV